MHIRYYFYGGGGERVKVPQRHLSEGEVEALKAVGAGDAAILREVAGLAGHHLAVRIVLLHLLGTVRCLWRKVLHGTHVGCPAGCHVRIAWPSELLASGAGRGLNRRPIRSNLEAPTLLWVVRYLLIIELAYGATSTVIGRDVLHHLPRIGVGRG